MDNLINWIKENVDEIIISNKNNTITWTNKKFEIDNTVKETFLLWKESNK